MMQPREIWVVQCMATYEIRRRYGVKCALNYLVGDKLLTFSAFADESEEYALELPRLQSAIWNIFDHHELAVYISTLNASFRHKVQALLLLECSPNASIPTA